MSNPWAGKPNCAQCGKKKGPKSASRKLCYSCRLKADQLAKQKVHDAHILRTYGITGELYRRLLEYQGGKCAICQLAFGKTKHLAVDHDHRCAGGHPEEQGCARCVRGLLCGMCNDFIGRVRDDPEVGHRMSLYLQFPPFQAMMAGEAACAS